MIWCQTLHHHAGRHLHSDVAASEQPVRWLHNEAQSELSHIQCGPSALKIGFQDECDRNQIRLQYQCSQWEFPLWHQLTEWSNGSVREEEKRKKLLNDEAPAEAWTLRTSAALSTAPLCWEEEKQQGRSSSPCMDVWKDDTALYTVIPQASSRRPEEGRWLITFSEWKKSFNYGQNSFVGQSIICALTRQIQMEASWMWLGSLAALAAGTLTPVGPLWDQTTPTLDLSDRLRAPSDSSRQIRYLERNSEKYIFLLPGTASRIFLARESNSLSSWICRVIHSNLNDRHAIKV